MGDGQEQHTNVEPVTNGGMQHQAAPDALQQDPEQALAGHVRAFEAVSLAKAPGSREVANGQASSYGNAARSMMRLLVPGILPTKGIALWCSRQRTRRSTLLGASGSTQRG